MKVVTGAPPPPSPPDQAASSEHTHSHGALPPVAELTALQGEAGDGAWPVSPTEGLLGELTRKHVAGGTGVQTRQLRRSASEPHPQATAVPTAALPRTFSTPADGASAALAAAGAGGSKYVGVWRALWASRWTAGATVKATGAAHTVGDFDGESRAARAADLAHLALNGEAAAQHELNFPRADYTDVLHETAAVPAATVLAVLAEATQDSVEERRYSRYRGVYRSANGNKWVAKILEEP